MGRMPVRSDLHIIPKAGHSFEFSNGRLAPETINEITRVILGWIDSL